jgi:hypothetical protein
MAPKKAEGWTTETSAVVLVRSGKNVIATVGGPGVPTKVAEQHARLMSAAPEMHAALTRLRRVRGQAFIPDDRLDAMVDAALAKANGVG